MKMEYGGKSPSMDMITTFRRRKALSFVFFAFIISFSGLMLFAPNRQRLQGLSGLTRTSAEIFGPYKGPYAVVTYLSRQFDGHENDDDNEDQYYVGARLLAYQLLHSPQTRLETSMPFIVLVTKDVRESKRQRLVKDGATVVEVDIVEHNVTIPRPNWVDTFSKMRVFDPNFVPYEKVLYLDTDTVLTRSMDAIFREPNTKPMQPLNETGRVKEDEGLLPVTFIFAAAGETLDTNHSYPVVDNDNPYFNSGLFVYSPSHAIFNYYLRIFEHTERWFHEAPDQDLLNYAHRWDGPLPWRSLHPSWTVLWPNDNDLQGGLAALHVKWWDTNYWIRSVIDYCLSKRWEMEGYWIGRNA